MSSGSLSIAPSDVAMRHWLRRRVPAILLCVMSALMSMIIIEQGHTIDSQRQLIHQLFQDSLALNAARMKLVQPKH